MKFLSFHIDVPIYGNKKRYPKIPLAIQMYSVLVYCYTKIGYLLAIHFRIGIIVKQLTLYPLRKLFFGNLFFFRRFGAAFKKKEMIKNVEGFYLASVISYPIYFPFHINTSYGIELHNLWNDGGNRLCYKPIYHQTKVQRCIL